MIVTENKTDFIQDYCDENLDRRILISNSGVYSALTLRPSDSDIKSNHKCLAKIIGEEILGDNNSLAFGIRHVWSRTPLGVTADNRHVFIMGLNVTDIITVHLVATRKIVRFLSHLLMTISNIALQPLPIQDFEGVVLPVAAAAEAGAPPAADPVADAADAAFEPAVDDPAAVDPGADEAAADPAADPAAEEPSAEGLVAEEPAAEFTFVPDPLVPADAAEPCFGAPVTLPERADCAPDAGAPDGCASGGGAPSAGGGGG
ncbi:unnamed protein product, partial [Medioppia subpectinata]